MTVPSSIGFDILWFVGVFAHLPLNLALDGYGQREAEQPASQSGSRIGKRALGFKPASTRSEP